MDMFPIFIWTKRISFILKYLNTIFTRLHWCANVSHSSRLTAQCETAEYGVNAGIKTRIISHMQHGALVGFHCLMLLCGKNNETVVMNKLTDNSCSLKTPPGKERRADAWTVGRQLCASSVSQWTPPPDTSSRQPKHKPSQTALEQKHANNKTRTTRERVITCHGNEPSFSQSLQLKNMEKHCQTF